MSAAARIQPDRSHATEARLAALEARVAVAEAEARAGGAALELLRDLTARVARLEDAVAGRVDEGVLTRTEAATILGVSVRELARIAAKEPELLDCQFRPGGPRSHIRYVRRKLLAYRERRG